MRSQGWRLNCYSKTEMYISSPLSLPTQPTFHSVDLFVPHYQPLSTLKACRYQYYKTGAQFLRENERTPLLLAVGHPIGLQSPSPDLPSLDHLPQPGNTTIAMSSRRSDPSALCLSPTKLPGRRKDACPKHRHVGLLPAKRLTHSSHDLPPARFTCFFVGPGPSSIARRT